MTAPRTSVLLLGAGFSANFGGFLANEMPGKLLACPQFDDELRELLHSYDNRGGFEAALGDLQTEARDAGRPTPRLLQFLGALRSVFDLMNREYKNVPFEWQNDRAFRLGTFLTRFDAIFSLNQDTLLEQHYLNDNVGLESAMRWSGPCLPGMVPNGPAPLFEGRFLGPWQPAAPPYSVPPRMQPYFKLHGSTNWHVAGSDEIMVLGTGKPGIIERFPVLAWYFQQFRQYLARPNVRLMTIGYGFADDHINEAIASAALGNEPRLWIVGPSGMKTLNRLGEHQRDLMRALRLKVIGESTRNLSALFGDDRVGHADLMRFFS
ncbi:MAG: SIR2 family protein [Alphaproteobacteria bacterium]|jgi:hypothetical protein|nr:SIR2 family protein [Alphaproteobacteria bacterium]